MKDGFVFKNKSDSKISNLELSLINNLTRRNFTEDEIYAFSVVLCDNEVDRENERFTDKTLQKLAELFIGKTGILDHNPTSENQTARIFSTRVEEVKDRFNKIQEPYKRLIARAYMPRCEKNENIILEIDSGIKKEVSVGCSISSKTCSICGQNLNLHSCNHIKGRRYKSSGIYQTCHTVLDEPTDAYEWSFVAVPAQREAGVIKAKALDVPLKGGEKSMEDVIKTLHSGEETVFSKAQSEKLFNLINNLEEKAQIGENYKKELRDEVVKLSRILQPETSSEVIENISKKLSIEELKAFKDSYRKKLSKMIPLSPQCCEEDEFSSYLSREESNFSFKI